MIIESLRSNEKLIIFLKLTRYSFGKYNTLNKTTGNVQKISKHILGCFKLFLSGQKPRKVLKHEVVLNLSSINI